jgi:type I restriction enzyme S subunit
MSLVGNPGAVAEVPKHLRGANLARQAALIALKSGVDASFVKYWFMSPPGRERLARVTKGSVQQVINLAELRKVEVWLPVIDTQRRIASILGAYDDLIEVNRRRVKVLEEMARGLFEEWFVRFRFPGHETVPLLDTPNGKLPEGWQWRTFGNLTDEVRVPVEPSQVDSETAYLGLEHLPRRSTTLTDRGKAVDVSSLKLRFQRGDILFGKIRPYFHKVVWAPIDGVCSTDTIVWRPKNGENARALAIASSDDFVAYSVKTSNGTKMPRANAKVLAAYRCAVAPPDVTGKFERVALSWIELSAALQAANERLAASRDLLLPRLISGQLSVEAAAPMLAAAE